MCTASVDRPKSTSTPQNTLVKANSLREKGWWPEDGITESTCICACITVK